MPQVTLTYTFDNEVEALKFLQRDPDGAKPGKPAPKAANAGSPPSAAPSPAPAAAAPAAAPAAAAPAAAPATDPKPVAYADSGLPALIKEAVGRDREGVIALLKKYGATKGDQLKPEQFDAFKAEIVTVGVSGDLA